MASNFESVAEAALQLDPEDRVKLAHRLIASVFPDQDVENAWAEEVERRVHAIESGSVDMLTAADAIARAHAAIK